MMMPWSSLLSLPILTCRVLIDNGIFASILFVLAFDKMKIGRDKLHPFHSPLVGWIKLRVTLRKEPHQITVWQNFTVVDCPPPYNVILGHLTLGKNQYHHLNLPLDNEIFYFNRGRRGEGLSKSC